MPAFIVGLMGAGHCLGMCGGIASALSFGIKDASFYKRMSVIFTYNLGRIFSYVLIGMVFGVLGYYFAAYNSQLTVIPLLRIVAAVMLVLMGFYIAGWWRILAVLERIGNTLWRRIQPVASKLLPVRNKKSAFLLGIVWGWLPCGLVYSVLVLAMAKARPLDAGLTMLAFGLGTMPAVFAGGVAAERLQQLVQKSGVRSIMGFALICFGAWTLIIALQHSTHQHHQHPAHEHGHVQNTPPGKASTISDYNDYTEQSSGHLPSFLFTQSYH